MMFTKVARMEIIIIMLRRLKACKAVFSSFSENSMWGLACRHNVSGSRALMVNYGYIYKALYVEVYKGLIGKIRRSFFFLFFKG